MWQKGATHGICKLEIYFWPHYRHNIASFHNIFKHLCTIQDNSEKNIEENEFIIGNILFLTPCGPYLFYFKLIREAGLYLTNLEWEKWLPVKISNNNNQGEHY